MQNGNQRTVQTLLAQLDPSPRSSGCYCRPHAPDPWVSKPLASRSTMQPWVWASRECDQYPPCMQYLTDEQGSTFVLR